MDASSGLRLVFAGTPAFAAEHLKALINSHHSVVGVYTQPDRPAGRGKALMASAVKQLAVEHNLPVYQPQNLKSPEEQQTLKSLNADAMIVVAYGLLLPPHILQTPPLGCLNVHASLLPRWRGAAPIQRAIEAGDPRSGITIMQMDEGLDTGDMLLTASCPIHDCDTAGDLHDRLLELGPPTLLTVLDQLQSGTEMRVVQDHTQSTYAKKLSREEAAINWSEDAHIICQKIRAFNPVPVCFTVLKKKDDKQNPSGKPGSKEAPSEDLRLRIFQAEPQISDTTNKMPGEILGVSTEGIQVACGKGVLNILSLQLPGKKLISIKQFINGHAKLLAPGMQFSQGNT